MSRNVFEILKKLIARRVNSPGFHSVYKQMRVVSGGDGAFCGELDVTPEMLNESKALHGGYTATLVDAATTYAISTMGNGNLGISLDMNISYLKPAFQNDTILIKATTLKYGKTTAVGTVDIVNKKTGDLIAHGRHTKFMDAK